VVLEEQVSGAFAARIAELLKRVEYRRADSPEDKEAIYRFRYEAYTRDGSIPPNPSKLFCDEEDEVPNAWLIGVYIDGALASSIRLHIGSRPGHYIPVAKVFPEIVLPRLRAGELLIDVTRQTSQLDFTRVYPFLTYITMRVIFLAEDHFGADYILAAARPEYMPAFRRMCGAQTWAPPRPYPRLAKLTALAAYDCKAKWSQTRERYPAARSTLEERIALFGRSSTVAYDPYEELTAGPRMRRLAAMQQSATYVA
jgi:hypothetical protein